MSAETVPKGYKRTEVGVIPKEWSAIKLGEIASFRTGPFGSALHKSDYTCDGIPIVNPMHITKNRIEPTRTMTITESAASKLSEFRVKSGEIIIGRRGDMGRCAVVPLESNGWLCGTGSMIIRPQNAEPNFLQMVLASPKIISSIVDASVGTTMINLNQRILSELYIQFPPKAEQQAIAAALSDADALIESLEQLLAKKRHIKQGAMQELLTGKRRLPGFTGAWETRKIGAIGATYGGLTGKSKVDFEVGTAQYITFMSVMKDVRIDPASFGKVRVGENESQNRALQGDLIFNGSSETPEDVALCALLEIDIENLYLNSFCFGFRFREDSQVNGLYLAYYIRSREGRELMKALAQGSTRYNMSKPALMDSSIEIPTLPEQTGIASVLSDMDAELDALEAKLDKALQIKQGMMQQLLTGKVRLV